MSRILLHNSHPLLGSDEIFAVRDMVRAAKKGIDLFQRHLLRLGDEEVHENSQEEVDTSKHIEGVEPTVLEEDREELLEDGIRDVLSL